MQTFTIEYDKEILNQLQRIWFVLTEIRDVLKNLSQQPDNPEEWLNASAFCRKFKISYPTLQKRIDSGHIEKKNFGSKYPRYRWKKMDGPYA